MDLYKAVITDLYCGPVGELLFSTRALALVIEMDPHKDKEKPLPRRRSFFR